MSAIQRNQLDLLEFIDWTGIECLNQNPSHPFGNALKQGYREDAGLFLESDADEQLLIYIPFTQVIKLHSMVLEGPEEEDTYAICKEFQMSGLSAKNGEQFGAFFNEEKGSDMKSEVGITEEVQEVAYDELPGEEKCDWQEQVFIMSALGMPPTHMGVPLNYREDYQGKKLQILIDEGRSLNLVTKETCTETGLHQQEQTSGVINVPDDWHLILGKEWVSQLGELKCNHHFQTLQPEWEGQHIQLWPYFTLEDHGSCALLTEVVPQLITEKKELKPELQVPGDLSIHWDGLKLQGDPYFISAVVPTGAGKAVGSTQQPLSVGILVNYKTITIFDPGGRKLSSEDQP